MKIMLKGILTQKKNPTTLIHGTDNVIHGAELQTASHKFIEYAQKILA